MADFWGGNKVGDEDQRGWWQASDGRWYPPSAHPETLAKVAQSPASDSPGIALARRGRHEAALPPTRAQRSIQGSSSHEFTLPVAAATFGADIDPDPILTSTAVLTPSHEPQQPPPAHEGGHFVAEYPPLASPSPQSFPPSIPVAPISNTPFAEAGWNATMPATGASPMFSPYAAGHYPGSGHNPYLLPGYYPGYTPSPKRTKLWIGLGVVGLVLVLLAVGGIVLLVRAAEPKHVLADPKAASTITLSSTVSAQKGRSVFTADFRDPGTSWSTLSLNSGASFRKDSSGYTISVEPDGIAWSPAPYRDRLDQIGISAVGTLIPSGTEALNGMGVGCTQDENKPTSLQYSFVLLENGSWTIASFRGDSSSPTVARIAHGVVQGLDVSTPITITAICATLADHTTTRLLFFLNGTRLTDVTDSRQSLPNVGWRSVVIGSSATEHSGYIPAPVATYTSFSVTDASK